MESRLSSPSRCCSSEEIWGEPYTSERSGLVWQPIKCSKCGKELFKTLLSVADRAKFEAFLEANDG